MRLRTKGIGRRITSLSMAVIMVLSGINMDGLGLVSAKAGTSDAVNIQIPKHEFATKQQLLDECDMNISDEESNSTNMYDTVPAFVLFGTNGERANKWFVAGKDTQNGTDTIALLSDYGFGEPRYFDEDSNAYSTSDVRTFLQSAYNGTDYFNTAQKAMIKKTTYKTLEGTSTSSLEVEGSDYLYLPNLASYNQSQFQYGELRIGAQDGILLTPMYDKFIPLSDVDVSSRFRYWWLRSPVFDATAEGKKVWNYTISPSYCEKKSINVSYGSGDGAIQGAYVIPAIDIDISNVLFASSAARTTGNIDTMLPRSNCENNAMTLRFDGTDVIKGNVGYSANDVTVSKGLGTDETLIIQGFT